MTSTRKSITAAGLWLAALAALAITPAPALARDCDREAAECWLSEGSTRCIHDYVRCLADTLINDY